MNFIQLMTELSFSSFYVIGRCGYSLHMLMFPVNIGGEVIYLQKFSLLLDFFKGKLVCSYGNRFCFTLRNYSITSWYNGKVYNSITFYFIYLLTTRV